MSKLISTNSAGEDPNNSERTANSAGQSQEGGRRRRGRIPDSEECLAALASLAGAVGMGFIKPAQASAMRASYAEILKFHKQHDRRDDRPGIADADVLELMRKDPKLFSVMEAFLTDEQIDMVMHGGKDGSGG